MDQQYCPNHCTSLSDLQLLSSHLLYTQQDALSSSCPTLKLLVPFLLTPTQSGITIAAEKPLQQTSTGNSDARQTLSLQSYTRGWYFEAFLSGPSWWPSSHLSSTRIIFLSSGDHNTMFKCTEVWITSWNCSFCPTSAFISCSIVSLGPWDVPGLVLFRTKKTGLITSLFTGHFICLSHQLRLARLCHGSPYAGLGLELFCTLSVCYQEIVEGRVLNTDCRKNKML